MGSTTKDDLEAANPLKTANYGMNNPCTSASATLLKVSKFPSQSSPVIYIWGRDKPHKDLTEAPEPLSILSTVNFMCFPSLSMRKCS